MEFFHCSTIPKHKKIAYANMVCDHRPLKKEKYRVRMTLGGDVLDYLGDASSPAASLIEAKLLFNSVISDSHCGARFLTLDIKDLFLQSILPDAEYLRIHSKYFLDDICQKYNIDTLVAPDGYVYCKIIRGMYGLQQAVKLARGQLITNLKPFGYFPSPHAPNIWVHESKPTNCFLCVDDFGVKYFSSADKDHLIQALKINYDITINIAGKDFCGLHLDWDCNQHWVDISIPQYVIKALKS